MHAAETLLNLRDSSDCLPKNKSENDHAAEHTEDVHLENPQAPGADIEASVHCQSNMTMEDIGRIIEDSMSLREENRALKQAAQCTFDERVLDSDETTMCLTGIPNGYLAKVVFDEISEFLPENSSLSKFSQFFMTLMRLRLDLPLQFLSTLFQVSTSTVSRTFKHVIHVMYVSLVPMLVFWPDREELRKTLPLSFRRTFSRCACIIDCFEVFTERSSSLEARALTYSNYKNHNTVKFLIGITPQGTISFISNGWSGRTSDKRLTENCGFLEKIQHGDVILADRGFTVQEAVGLQMGELRIPAFMKGKNQLSALDVETTRKLASQRIHVERVIGVVRQKFTILQGTIPITMLMSEPGEPTTLDQIVSVACGLCNLNSSVVPFD